MIRFRDLVLVAIVWFAAGVVSDALQMERLFAGFFIAVVTVVALLGFWQWEGTQS